MLAIIIMVSLSSQSPPAVLSQTSELPLVVATAEVDALVKGLFDADEPAHVALPGVLVCDLAIARDSDLKATTCIERQLRSCRPAVAARAAIDWSSHEWTYFGILWVRPRPNGCDLISIMDKRVPAGARRSDELKAWKCTLPFEFGFHPVPDIRDLIRCEQEVTLTKQ